MAVEGQRRAELIDGPREAGGAEERKDFERLAFDGGPGRRVMEERDAHPCSQLEEGILELELLGDAVVDEGLELGLTKPLELRVLEPTAKSPRSRDAQIALGERLSVEDVDAGGRQLRAHHRLLA